ncbi:hypothetical protein PZA11_001972 [Diplocarpon coronariae]
MLQSQGQEQAPQLLEAPPQATSEEARQLLLEALIDRKLRQDIEALKGNTERGSSLKLIEAQPKVLNIRAFRKRKKPNKEQEIVPIPLRRSKRRKGSGNAIYAICIKDLLLALKEPKTHQLK